MLLLLRMQLICCLFIQTQTTLLYLLHEFILLLLFTIRQIHQAPKYENETTTFSFIFNDIIVNKLDVWTALKRNSTSMFVLIQGLVDTIHFLSNFKIRFKKN